jgi:hypothetical protein
MCVCDLDLAPALVHALRTLLVAVALLALLAFLAVEPLLYPWPPCW